MSWSESGSTMDKPREQSIDELKKTRSSAKASITRKINRLTELMLSNKNAGVVKEISNDLEGVLNEFMTAHEAYNDQLTCKDELEQSASYREGVFEQVRAIKTKIDSWLKSLVIDDEAVVDVHPEDSASNVPSRTSSRARSKTSSTRSSASAKARAAAKKAALETKAASARVAI